MRVTRQITRYLVVIIVIAFVTPASAQTVVNQGSGNRNVTPWVVQGSGSSTAAAIPVNPAAQVAGETQETCVTNAAGGTAVPATPLASRREITIQNLGPNAIFCTNDGSAPLSTGANGWRIDATGGWFSFAWGPAIIVKCIAATAAQVTPACSQVVEAR
jgi:hypothetical protein